MTYRLRSFSRIRFLSSVAVCAGVFAVSGTALACRIAPPARHEIVADPTDTTAPSITVLEIDDIVRGQQSGGCTGGHDSCSDVARVVLSLAATDDASQPSAIGFRVRVVEGTLGRGALPVDYAADVSTVPFQIVWAETEPESFRAVLEVVAVDRAGNISAPMRLAVEDGGLACAASGGGLRSAWGFAPVALVLAAIARRARRRARDSAAG